MKLILLPLLVLVGQLMAITPQIKAVGDNPGYVEVIHSAMLKGSSKELSRYFQQDLHLRVGNLSGKFPKKQAEYLLSEFFNQYPPKEFEVVHNGETSEKIRFVMGYFSAEGKTFYLLVKAKRDELGSMKICELELSTP
jgi:hypothetical protein